MSLWTSVRQPKVSLLIFYVQSILFGAEYKISDGVSTLNLKLQLSALPAGINSCF